MADRVVRLEGTVDPLASLIGQRSDVLERSRGGSRVGLAKRIEGRGLLAPGLVEARVGVGPVFPQLETLRPQRMRACGHLLDGSEGRSGLLNRASTWPEALGDRPECRARLGDHLAGTNRVGREELLGLGEEPVEHRARWYRGRRQSGRCDRRE